MNSVETKKKYTKDNLKITRVKTKLDVKTMCPSCKKDNECAYICTIYKKDKKIKYDVYECGWCQQFFKH